MLVYVADKKQFLHDCDFDDIEEVIQGKFIEVTGKRVTDLIIRNTYRTLLTRGKRGCYVYSTDKETRDYCRLLVK